MLTPSMIIIFVDNPAASAAFYQDLLGTAPVETSPTVAMFAGPGAPSLDLCSRRAVEPAATAGGGEIGFPVESPAVVDAPHADWLARGLTILQAPTQMDFGRTFVALDPDGHRLRVFAPGAA